MTPSCIYFSGFGIFRTARPLGFARALAEHRFLEISPLRLVFAHPLHGI